MASSVVETRCCVVGGGPAGMMLAYLLARKGVDVTVLEKHEDFFRDFRGDTVHPSTLEVLAELGLLQEFLQLPHQKVESVGIVLGNSTFEAADFRHVPTQCKFVALMPQWDFLNFLSDHAKTLPAFQLRMKHEAVDLLRDGKRIVGVLARNDGHEVQVYADLVVGCDGRHSVTRQAAGLEVIEHGVPIDVLWFRISRRPDDPAQVLGNVNYGKALILIDRSDYFQAGLIIPKGSYSEIQTLGIEAFRALHSSNRSLVGRASRTNCATGNKSKSSPFRSIGCDAGTGLDCSVSETRPMPCLQRAAWALTLPFRTASRRRTC